MNNRIINSLLRIIVCIIDAAPFAAAGAGSNSIPWLESGNKSIVLVLACCPRAHVCAAAYALLTTMLLVQGCVGLLVYCWSCLKYCSFGDFICALVHPSGQSTQSFHACVL